VGAIDAAALGPFVKWAHGHGVTRKFCVFTWFHTAGSGVTVTSQRDSKSNKINSGRGFAPDPAETLLRCSPDPVTQCRIKHRILWRIDLTHTQNSRFRLIKLRRLRNFRLAEQYKVRVQYYCLLSMTTNYRYVSLY